MVSPGPALPRSDFSTDAVAPEHRFEAWRSALASSHVIEAEPTGFFGRVQSVQAGRLTVHNLDSAPVALDRSPDTIRRDGLDHIVLHLSRHAIQARAADLALDIPAGSFSVNDLSRPTLRRPAAETASLVAVLPRDLIRDAGASSDALHGQIVQGGAGVLLAAHLRNLVDNASTIPASAGPGLALATAHLVAACLNPLPQAGGPAASAIASAKLARARAFIDANLARTDLTPELIGRAVGLSRAALFRAFEPEGGVAAYLWFQRLDAIRRALRDPRETRPIGRLGMDYGFSSSAHLSRAFRRQFGHSPREFRNEAGGVR